LNGPDVSFGSAPLDRPRELGVEKKRIQPIGLINQFGLIHTAPLGANQWTNEWRFLYGVQKPSEKPEALFGLGASSTSARNGRLHCHAKDEASYKSANAFLWVSPEMDSSCFWTLQGLRGSLVLVSMLPRWLNSAGSNMRDDGSGDTRTHQQNKELQPGGHRILLDSGTKPGARHNCTPSVQDEPDVPRVAIQIRDSNRYTTM
jgi:hypothetical protein